MKTRRAWSNWVRIPALVALIGLSAAFNVQAQNPPGLPDTADVTCLGLEPGEARSIDFWGEVACRGTDYWDDLIALEQDAQRDYLQELEREPYRSVQDVTWSTQPATQPSVSTWDAPGVDYWAHLLRMEQEAYEDYLRELERDPFRAE